MEHLLLQRPFERTPTNLNILNEAGRGVCRIFHRWGSTMWDQNLQAILIGRIRKPSFDQKRGVSSACPPPPPTRTRLMELECEILADLAIVYAVTIKGVDKF